MDKKVRIIGAQDTVFNRFLQEMREESVQRDRLRFRTNLERAAQVLAYEASKLLPYSNREVVTPLGSLPMSLPSEEPVVMSILRAGLPMHVGFLHFFDHADNGFISAYRHHTSEDEFIIKVEYLAAPSLEGRILVLLDPMIATGKSIVLAHQAILEQTGTPRKVIICGIIGSEEGVGYVRRRLPDAEILIGAVDKELTAKSYIVPGLGDAGDLAYGSKE
jgi:uracil phosphoribosyltransferase